jgi:hypothetical protein
MALALVAERYASGRRPGRLAGSLAVTRFTVGEEGDLSGLYPSGFVEERRVGSGSAPMKLRSIPVTLRRPQLCRGSGRAPSPGVRGISESVRDCAG